MLPAIPILPVAVLGLTGLAAYKASQRGKFHGEMTAERQIVYQTALESLKEPWKLNKLADAFEKQGLREQADHLRKRAALKTQPSDVKAKRNEAFRKGMQSNDPAAIRKLAQAFSSVGADGAAANLRRRADALSVQTGVG